MKVFESKCTFDYSWEEVSRANWRKYCAWNDKASHVVSVDTLSRSIDPATGILRTERLIACKQSVPRWLMVVVGGADVSYVREISYVDPVAKTVRMESQNLTFSNLLSVFETVTYRPDPSNPETKTIFEQDAQFKAAGGFSRFCNKIEDWSVERFGQNASLGREGFESVLRMSRQAWNDLRDQSSSLPTMAAASAPSSA
ncbi:hypothetical protein TWF106_011106 [Orbilia oligospora]|uniref:PRELI/MSF1 domain-containing protein n=1 Tax=Orbilia oligospora TaxID=2813651 RepID=A0A6G1M139_ORBOL|nr:hypothetical protein TWF788_002803 [Orbilia oligospora]KAF3196756.1 hypothetical protein TWF679_004116 [Orbilia oligospora]KAF3209137.1 hypothetical protein TWF106_011106 [Orbilia oligospora]KAF3214266.1 hypothetical protein TWF191_009782 [Orbilia oligospora]KAF3241410.1 hypothetical protein TWF192_009150 [Orbilia oligospora]